MTIRDSSDSERLERIERIVEGIARDQVAMNADISSMKDDISVLKSDVVDLKADVAELKSDVAGLKSDVAMLKAEMSVVKGWQTELAVERRARDVFRRLCRGHLLRFYPDEELHHYVRELTNTGAITRDDASRAESIDFLLEGTDAEGVAVMYAVEVSYTVGVGDCERAIDKAALLTRMLRREVKPAVVGEVFTAGFAQAADMQSVAFTHISNGNEIIR